MGPFLYPSIDCAMPMKFLKHLFDNSMIASIIQQDQASPFDKPKTGLVKKFKSSYNKFM